MSVIAGFPVVVGVDGSASALEAVRLAAREAMLRRRPLRIVHGFVWPLLNVPLGPSPYGPAEGGLRNQAEQFVAEAVAEAHKTAQDLTVTGEVIDGRPASVLLRAAHQAALLVLGSRGLGGFGGLLLGSTAVQVSAYAECPVLVVRAEPRADGPVVVGVDGSELSKHAINFAFEEAAQRGSELVAVHAWTHPVPSGPGDILPAVYDPELVREEEERVLAESLAGFAEGYPQVRVRQRLVRGVPSKVLVEESAAAQLVVVGARGCGGFTGLLLGSVSHGVLHHAHCPVAIVRPHSDESR